MADHESGLSPFQASAQIRSLVRQRDAAHRALADLLAAVNLLTLADPTKYVIANAVAGPALAAGQVLQRAGRYEWIAEAVTRLEASEA